MLIDSTPAEQNSQPSTSPIWIQDACDIYFVDLSLASGWIKKGKLKSLGKLKLPSGQKGVFVDENEFRDLAQQRITGQVSKDFFYDCTNGGCVPIKALEKIAFTAQFERDGESFYDVDVTYSAIRLGLQPRSHFFQYLCCERNPDDSFASAVAEFLGTEEALHLNRQPDDDTKVFNLDLFCDYYQRCIQQYASNGVAYRNLVKGTRPKYLDHIKCKEVPAWAEQSVWPITQHEATKKIYARLALEAGKNPDLKEFLKAVNASLADLPPRHGYPSEDAEIRDPMVAQEIEHIVDQMVVLGAEKETAQVYCHAQWRLFHHEQRRALRQMSESDWSGMYRPRTIPFEVVKRIFGAGLKGTAK